MSEPTLREKIANLGGTSHVVRREDVLALLDESEKNQCTCCPHLQNLKNALQVADEAKDYPEAVSILKALAVVKAIDAHAAAEEMGCRDGVGVRAILASDKKPIIHSSEVLHHTAKETAAIIRADLKREFPGTKFSVLVGRASMSSNVEVSWEKGPMQAAVDTVVGKYATYECYYGEDGKWDCNRPIEIDTPEGKRWAHFVNKVYLKRRKWL